MTEIRVAAQRVMMERRAREDFYYFLVMFLPLALRGRRFIETPHVEALCYMAQSALAGTGARHVLVTLPPRYLKSITISVLFCAWVLGRDPSKLIMVASYGMTLSEQHGRTFRRIVRSPQYRRMFPAMQIETDNAEELTTTLGGGRRNVSIGSGVTGLGADIVIVDDLLKAQEIMSEASRTAQKTFVDQALYSRLEDKKNALFFVIQQRLHEDDVIQHQIDKGGWDEFSMPAIATDYQSFPLYRGRHFIRQLGDVLAPKIEDRETLAEIERQMTSRVFSAQYQQNPIPVGGDIIRWGWFDRYESMGDRADYDYVIQSYDTASSLEPGSAFSVCITFGLYERRWEILDIWRDRVTMPDLVKQTRRLYREWVPDKLLIENKSSGIGLIQMLGDDPRFLGRRKIISINPTVDTADRMVHFSPLLEQRLVQLPEQEVDWVTAFRHECAAFPNGRYMDQVDALSQFLYWTSTRTGRNVVNPPPTRDLSGSLRSAVFDPLGPFGGLTGRY